MPRTGLHKLLSEAQEWSNDLSFDVADYLVDHCTGEDLIRLAELLGQPHLAVMKKDRPSEVDKVLSSEYLAHRASSPQALLTAWEQARSEHVEAQEARRRVAKAPDIRTLAPKQRQLFDELSGVEVAGLYIGIARIAYMTWKRQFQPKPPRGIGMDIQNTSLHRGALESDLALYIAQATANKAEVIIETLKACPDGAPQRLAETLMAGREIRHG